MRKTLLSFSASLLALSLASCGSGSDAANDPNTLINNDFETLAGWLPDPQNATLSRDKAHSGRYALKVDAAHDYSLSYRAPLGQLHDTRIKKIKISAWAFVPAGGSTASLVTTVGNPAKPDDKPMLWEALELAKGNAVGKWVEVSKVIAIPETAAPTHTLGFYLWRTGGNQPVYLDDLRVAIAE